MTISEAMRAVSDEYDGEVDQARRDPGFNRLMRERVVAENAEVDEELPAYIAEVAAGMGVEPGTILPDYVYVAARMCFRFGMRTQRKLDRPAEETSAFWREAQAH